MSQQLLGIVGAGTVGQAVARGFMEHAEVRVYDVLPERRTHSLEKVLECDVLFICLPTPTDGENLNPRYVEDFVLAVLARHASYYQGILVIKSTLPVGTTFRLRQETGLKLLHSPEFLTARCSIVDFQCPAQNVIGAPGFNNDGAVLAPWVGTLKELYERRFPGVPCRIMDSNSSELAKICLNTFFKAKVSMFNLFYDACELAGASFEDVSDVLLGDGRIAISHHKVPGPDGKRGSGQACLSKDPDALCAIFDEKINAYTEGPIDLKAEKATELLQAIKDYNFEIRGAHV